MSLIVLFLGASCRDSPRTKVRSVHISDDLFKHIQLRETGLKRYSYVSAKKLSDEFVSQLMPQLFREKEYKLGKINKIFTSQWLNDRQVVFGTKCNKVYSFEITILKKVKLKECVLHSKTNIYLSPVIV